MNGVLVVDKPAGPTSHDVVARVRRALRERRIGHTGTLDPLATGVLVLVIGRATRLASLLSGAVKEYDAWVRFGASTATYDAEERISRDGAGVMTAIAPPPAPHGLTADTLEAVLPEFHGTLLQAPPPFSAKKVEGVRAYRRARRRETVSPRPVAVTVDRLSLVSYADGLALLQITCSAGFYVRALAHTLGERLGCGAYLERLRRTRAGDFGLEQAVALETLEAEGAEAAARIVPLDRLLPELPEAVLTEGGARRARHGNRLGPDDIARGRPPAGPAARWRLLDPSGTLVAIADLEAGGLLHPVIVLG